MLKKLLSVIALALVTHLSASAAYSVTIERKSASDEVFLLETKPRFEFDGPDLMITAEGSAISIPRSDISNIRFAEVQGDVSAIEATDSESVVAVLDGCNYRINAVNVMVYDLNGRIAAGAEIDSDGTSTIVNLSQCVTGVYIIVYNDKSFKVLKK